jgi:hypothetical protein
MRYFSHVMAVGFFALAAFLHSWPLGVCAVAVLALVSAKEAYESYLRIAQEKNVQESVEKVLEDNKKLRDELTKVQNSVGAMNFKVQQFAQYVGAPEN